MDNFKFRSFPSNTLTNIQDVAVNYNNKSNGYPHADYGNFSSSGEIRNVVDGTGMQEGVTTCNNAYTNNGDDILKGESVLAHYDFYNTPGTYYGNAPPDWCDYMKVFLIGGGGGGARSFQSLAPFSTLYCGDGGGAGEQVIIGVENPHPGSGLKPTITVGSGGTTEEGAQSNILFEYADPGGNGGSSQFSYSSTSSSASGGNGGLNSFSSGAFPSDSGAGGNAGGHGNDTEIRDNRVGLPGSLKGVYKVSGNSSTRTYTTRPGGLPYHTSGVNAGGVGALTQTQAEQYGFSGGLVSGTKALVREMIQSFQPGNGYGSGGNGSAASYEYQTNTAGQKGCVCVFYFPGNPLKYPIA